MDEEQSERMGNGQPMDGLQADREDRVRLPYSSVVDVSQ
jgi:hypothetical protein